MKNPATGVKHMKLLFFVLLLWLVLVGVYQSTKKMPENTDFRGKVRHIPVGNIEFLYDLTYTVADGRIVSEQRIFDEIFALIRQAKEYILIDAFLFNSYTREPADVHRPLADELATELVQKKNVDQDIRIDFITDPINTVYGGAKNSEIERLRKAGVNVVTTDLRALPDSNPIYSALWRTFLQWFGNSNRRGLVPHPFTGSEPKVTLRSYLTMLNFKANHRKIFLADTQRSSSLIITSANPHGGSAAHSNVALKVTGGLWRDVYDAEAAVAGFSGRKLQGPPSGPDSQTALGGERARAVFLTENRIKKELLARIGDTILGDGILMALFYLADRDIIEALVDASHRGVGIRLVLDPNKDAFGFEKSGIPNRPVAEELVSRSSGRIAVRWYDTHGEQFHSKMTVINRGSQTTLILGSANLTRRNLENYNLEANVAVTADSNAAFNRAAADYFENIWSNRDGRHYTVDYDVYRDDSTIKRMIYLVQEYAGLSSF